MPIGAQAIDASNVIMRPSDSVARGIFDSSKRLGERTSSKTAFGGTATKAANEGNTQSTKNLTYDEVKALSDEHMLPCKSIYELHAEFNSLL